MKVSAIVVNWNGKDVLSECLESLLKQDLPELEIIVSDNGSSDGSVERVRDRFPQVRLLQNEKNLGFGTAVNRGFEVAQGDGLIFLNNDLRLEPGCLRTLAQVLENDPAVGAAVPKILYVEKPETVNSLGVSIHFTGIACPHRIDESDPGAIPGFETACGGIFLFRREIYETLGGFDEDLFLYHEDHDLSWRIRLQGWKLWVVPGAVMRHHYHFGKGAHKFYHSEKNRLHLLLKNLNARTLGLCLPALVAVEAAQWAHAALNGWFFLKLKSYAELCGQVPRILAKRRKIQRHRKVPDRDIVRLYEGTLRVSGIQNPLLDKILSPGLEKYWTLIRPWI